MRDRLIDLLDLSERYRFDSDQGVRAARAFPRASIHQGCNRACTYCIVPSTRGGERSRPPAVIVDEVRRLCERGTKEVVLLSQIVERYGRDLRPRVRLSELLQMLNDQVPGLERIRFLTSYPGDFGRDLVDAVADLPRVCEDVNLPIQSGDDAVLGRMHRGYVVDHYRQLIWKLRERVADIGLSTDVIVGFPGETEAEFDNTLGMLDEFRFDVVHVAMYSPRPGTVAATEMLDDVPREEKRRRLHEVESLQKRVATAINARYLGRTVDVLVEGVAKGRWYGRTRTNKLVHFASDRAARRRAGRRGDHRDRAVVPGGRARPHRFARSRPTFRECSGKACAAQRYGRHVPERSFRKCRGTCCAKERAQQCGLLCWGGSVAVPLERG